MTPLRPSRPPTDCVELRRWTLGEPGELSDLRRSLRDELSDETIGDAGELADVPEKVVLVASELATNALRHGLPPTVVRLLRADRGYILDVADHEPAVLPSPADDDRHEEGGRGLRIARRLALDVGWYATPSLKHVWARFE
jgi:serine/threonine-protein kinase RsbW